MATDAVYSTRSALLTILSGMSAQSEEADIGHLVHLVRWLKVGATGSDFEIDRRFLMWVEVLEHDPALRAQVKDYLEQFLQESKYRYTFAELGILGSETFGQALKSRLFQRLLPATVEDKTVRESLNILFPKSDDHEWFDKISMEAWLRLFDALEWNNPDHPLWRRIQHEMLEAMEMLAVRIAALGIEGEVVRCLGMSDRHTSPFVEQHMELRKVIEQAHIQLSEQGRLDELGGHLDVLLDQCTDQIRKAHAQARLQGLSMALSLQLIRLEQSITRMRILLQLLGALPVESRAEASVSFFRTLVREENRKHSISDLWRSYTEKMAMRITEHASQAGEHYAAESRREYWGIARAALIGGFFIALFAFVKVWLVSLHLPLLLEAVAFSFNYALCFVVVHLFHGTVATKQPAMTAASIAAAIDSAGGRMRSYDKVIALVAQVSRAQFVAIFGNMVLAALTGMAISYVWTLAFGFEPVSEDKTALLLHSINPVTSAAVPHAAVAGVCLFLTGVVSGYYDNLCLYERIPLRLRQVVWLKKILGISRLQRFANYLEGNLGALMGCIFLGIMLGSLGFVGLILGLPLDTTHFAFSSANMGFAFQSGGADIGWWTVGMSILGIFAIGAGNLSVSFALALYTAMRARGVRVIQGGVLLRKLLQGFLKQPKLFFFPPSK